MDEEKQEKIELKKWIYLNRNQKRKKKVRETEQKKGEGNKV